MQGPALYFWLAENPSGQPARQASLRGTLSSNGGQHLWGQSLLEHCSQVRWMLSSGHCAGSPANLLCELASGAVGAGS